MHECKAQAQSNAIEYFVAGYLTMARISDMKSWTQANLVKIHDQDYLKYYQVKLKNKSSKIITVPVPEILMALFRKNIFAHNGRLLPWVDNNINFNLRMALKKYDVFDKPATRERVKAGKRVGTAEDGLKTYDILHIHMVRATAITHLLEDGATDFEVKQFSGHTINSSAFQRYTGELTLEAKTRIYDRYLKAVGL
jgi:integrase